MKDELTSSFILHPSRSATGCIHPLKSTSGATPVTRTLAIIFCAIPTVALAQQTIAEKSDYKATSRHADVVGFCEELAKNSPNVRQTNIGKSGEGRDLPMLILADPPVTTPEEATRNKKLVVLAFANIHAGEVDGKEAALMLARDIATGDDKSLLKELVILIVPILNADGNEKIDKTNRTSQNGPGGRRRHPRQRGRLRPEPRLRQAGDARSTRAGQDHQPLGPRGHR